MSDMDMKAENYIIDATMKIRHKVQFEKPVTFEEAKEMFANDEYYDCSDEAPLEVVSVDKVTQYGF